jgi:hypothetical protein
MTKALIEEVIAHYKNIEEETSWKFYFISVHIY